MNRREKNRRMKNNSWENLQGFRYAHRGLFHEPSSASRKVLIPEMAPLWREAVWRWKKEGKRIIPENSMKAFRLAVRHGFGSELDVHLTADDRLVVFHDDSLLRMTGTDRRIEEMTWDELRQIRLLDTECRIPLLEEVFDLYTSSAALTQRVDRRRPEGRSPGRKHLKFQGPAGNESEGRSPDKDRPEFRMLHLPLIIELKTAGNAARLCSRVTELADRYPALNYCMESFDPRAVYWLRRNRPDVIRGQLTENFMKSREAVRQWGYLMTFGMWSVAPDILSRPDFIACKYCDRKNIFILLSNRLGVRRVNWVIRNHEELAKVDGEGGLSIFERFIPDALPF